MTSPGVMAMSSPTRKPSGAGVGSSATARKLSSSQLAVPRARFAPASSMVRAMTTGLSHGTFEGENTSSHLARHEVDARGVLWRHAAHFAGCGAPPVFLGEKQLFPKQIGRLVPLRIGKAVIAGLWRKWRVRLLSGLQVPGKACKPRRRNPGPQRQFKLASRCAAEVRDPIRVGGELRVRRNPLGDPRRHRPGKLVECFERRQFHRLWLRRWVLSRRGRAAGAPAVTGRTSWAEGAIASIVVLLDLLEILKVAKRVPRTPAIASSGPARAHHQGSLWCSRRTPVPAPGCAHRRRARSDRLGARRLRPPECPRPSRAAAATWFPH